MEPLDNVIIKPMLNAGSIALPWEPYTGGQPSPNPDYPQEIVNAGQDGQIDVTVCGANIFDVNSTITGYYASDGSFISSNVNRQSTKNIPTRGQKAVTFSNLPVNVKVIAVQFDDKNTFVYREGNLTDGKIFSIREQSVYVAFSFYKDDNSMVSQSDLTGVMINYGEAVLPFEPYYSPQQLPIPTPDGLPGIPVDSGGNWVDENGKQWVSDVVDLAVGTKTQNVYTIRVSDYLNTLNRSSNPSGDTYYISVKSEHITIPNKKNNRDFGMLSNYFKAGNAYSNIIKFDIANIISDIQQPRFCFGPIGSMPTLKDAKVYFESHDVVVMYPLATPITTPLDDATIAAYAALMSYDGSTVISTDEDVSGISAKVVTDVISKNAWFDPYAELSLYYKALAGFESLDNLPMPHSRESSLVRKLLDSSYELGFSVNETSSRNEKYLWDLINGTSTMLTNVPKSDTEKFLHVMIGGNVEEYPVVDTELDYWMDKCVHYMSSNSNIGG